MFRLAAVFSDHCVLQREKEICIFGQGENGQRVTAALFRGGEPLRSGEAEVKDGQWSVRLAPMQANDSLTLSARCGDETVTFTDVSVGEVWLCGGQSNMEFELQNCTTGKEHLEGDRPDVRFYYTQKKTLTEPDFLTCEQNTAWSLFSPESARCWSAVGYIFGKELSERLSVTVGLIGCNWGGTSASAWLPQESLSEDKDTDSYLADYNKGIEGKSLAQQKAEYDAYTLRVNEWNTKYGELLKTSPGMDWAQAEKILGKNPWPGPINAFNPFRPGALYESMLLRVCPYTLRGWLFYQGESDDHKPNIYYKLFRRMIRAWRECWGEEAPFLFVQLPGHRYEGDPDYKHWCLIREAQFNVSKTVPGTGMICAIDAGEFNDIHPKNKEPVGHRLCLLALEKVYGLLSAEEAESPEVQNIRFDGDTAAVRFAHTGGGLTVKGGEISGFELAGKDGVYLPAKARLAEDGKTVLLKADGLTAPAFVRYLWTNYPEKVSLYGNNGLPALPFRTDSQTGADARTGGIQQVMEL
ncbi:MAG: sialate O-acetylesterase [Clostridia bacterium]|nr:sialate O-acetylesterase [Clostridia bacterium]